MIIIDEHAEEKLLRHLHRLQKAPEGWRCLHLHSHRNDMLATLDDAIEAHEKFVYLAADGTTYLLGLGMSVRDIRRASMSVPANIFDPAHDLYELELNWHRLIFLVEELHNRLEADQIRRQREEEAAKQAARRQALLNLPLSNQLIATIPERRQAHTRPEIMLVEDDPFSRRLVENTLREKFSMTTAPDAREAILTYAQRAPHILFLDINLPDLSGHDVLHRLLDMDKAAYIVMLSGQGDKANVLRAVQHGAAGFIAKPFTRDKLFQYIERCPLLPVSTGGAL